MQPIVVIDSGLGGLLITKTIREQYKNIPIVYLGDSAFAPYGDKNKSVIIERACVLINKAVSFNPQCIVIACNTLEAVASDVIKLKVKNIHLITIVQPTVDFAWINYHPKNILLLATSNTVKSNIYSKALERKGVKVSQLACPMFVEYIEGKSQHKNAYDVVHATLQNTSQHYDMVILGCTHYPYLYQELKNYLPKDAKILDSSQAILSELSKVIKNEPSYNGTINIIFSDISDKVKESVEKLFGEVKITLF